MTRLAPQKRTGLFPMRFDAKFSKVLEDCWRGRGQNFFRLLTALKISQESRLFLWITAQKVVFFAKYQHLTTWFFYSLLRSSVKEVVKSIIKLRDSVSSRKFFHTSLWLLGRIWKQIKNWSYYSSISESPELPTDSMF